MKHVQHRMDWTRMLLAALSLFLATNASARKFHFDINAQREVTVVRSATMGTKMLKVVAYGRSADAAISQAMVDAVAVLSFFGAAGEGEMEGCPPVLYKGQATYEDNKAFFDDFFKKGDFLPYVKRVNNSYPSGINNVKTAKGRRIQILLIVDWNGLAAYYKRAGYKTAVSELENY